MAYSRFKTIEQVETQLGVTVAQTEDLFPNITPVTPGLLLTETLKANLPLVLAFGSEKARSELIVSPLLVEVRRLFHEQISLFAGAAFDVDHKLGIDGYCDWLLSASPVQLTIKAPVVALVEAKKGDLSAGLAQCIAEMVAARLFNERHDNPIVTIYGTVTSGTDWKFVQLEGNTATVGLREYPIEAVESLLGIFIHLFRKTPSA